MKMLVDVHAHLDMVENLDKTIENAKKAGLKAIITNGINPETNRQVLEIAKKYDIVKAALGIYPIEALKIEGHHEMFDIDEEIDFIEKNKNRVIALGEVGLDFYWTKEKIKQKLAFEKIIALAEKIDKPVIVHSRKAEVDVIEMLESSNLKKIVMHCFGGKLKLAKKIAELGWSFSVPTNVVKNESMQKIVEAVNINQLLTETDTPYLSPFVGKKNEPAFIIEAVKKIAEIKGFEQKEVENNIWMNYQNMFL